MTKKSQPTKASGQPAPPQVPTPPSGQPAAPQPVAQPAAPVAPGAPVALGQMPPKKGLSKGALWAIIGGSIAGIVTIILIIVAVVLLSGPSKSDYRSLAALVSSFDSSSAAVTSSSSAEGYKEQINDLIKQADDYHKKIADHKAMKDKDLKAAYDSYLKDWDETKKKLLSTAEFAEAYINYGKNCTDLYFSTYTNRFGEEMGKLFDEKTSDCTSALDKMSKSSDSAVSKYAKEMKEYLKSLRSYYVELANRNTNKDYSSPYPKFPQCPKTSLSSTTTELSSSLNKMKSSYRNFKRLINEKINS